MGNASPILVLKNESGLYDLCRATRSMARLGIWIAPEMLNEVAWRAARAPYLTSGPKIQLLLAFAVYGHTPGDRRSQTVPVLTHHLSLHIQLLSASH